jgi:hypothetical protein
MPGGCYLNGPSPRRTPGGCRTSGVPVATARKWASSVRRGWRLTRTAPGSSARARARQTPARGSAPLAGSRSAAADHARPRRDATAHRLPRNRRDPSTAGRGHSPRRGGRGMGTKRRREDRRDLDVLPQSALAPVLGAADGLRRAVGEPAEAALAIPARSPARALPSHLRPTPRQLGGGSGCYHACSGGFSPIPSVRYVVAAPAAADHGGQERRWPPT